MSNDKQGDDHGFWQDALAGAQNALKLEDARNSVSVVVAELSDVLNRRTGGALRASLSKRTYKSRATYVSSYYKALGLDPVPQERTVDALFLGSDEAKRPIADVRFDDAGFPVLLEWEGGGIHCDNTDALRSGLKAVLRSTQAGEALVALAPDHFRGSKTEE